MNNLISGEEFAETMETVLGSVLDSLLYAFSDTNIKILSIKVIAANMDSLMLEEAEFVHSSLDALMERGNFGPWGNGGIK